MVEYETDELIMTINAKLCTNKILSDFRKPLKNPCSEAIHQVLCICVFTIEYNI